MNEELKHILQEAVGEIRHLRRQNEVLSAQVRIIEIFEMALFSQPNRNGIMSPDVAWRIEQLLQECELKK